VLPEPSPECPGRFPVVNTAADTIEPGLPFSRPGNGGALRDFWAGERGGLFLPDFPRRVFHWISPSKKRMMVGMGGWQGRSGFGAERWNAQETACQSERNCSGRRKGGREAADRTQPQ